MTTARWGRPQSPSSAVPSVPPVPPAIEPPTLTPPSVAAPAVPALSVPWPTPPAEVPEATEAPPFELPELDWPTDPAADLTADPLTAAAHAAAPSSPPVEEWRYDASGHALTPHSMVHVLGSLSDKVTRGALAEYQPIPLGFTPLDKSLGGGMRAGELVLIGGAQGTGKTTLALQVARNIAIGGQATVLYVCFEHDDEYLLNRLIALESVIDHMPQPSNGLKLGDVRREVLATSLAQGSSEMAELAANPRLRGSIEKISRYGENLFLMRGTQTATTIDNLRRLVEMHRQQSPERALVVFVDYLQKVPAIPDPTSETERVTVVVNGLKDLALSQGVAVVSIVAADKDGLKASRLRSHHLRGSSAINYEADVIIILNEKYNIVAKVNIEFNPYQAQRFRDWIVLTVEKNRSGQHSVDVEFEKHFEYACFDPTGRAVQEKLIEERLFND